MLFELKGDLNSLIIMCLSVCMFVSRLSTSLSKKKKKEEEEKAGWSDERKEE